MLTSQDIMSHGYTGKKVGEILKYSKTWTEDQVIKFRQTGVRPTFAKKDLSIKLDSVLSWFVNNECVNTLKQSSITQKRQWLNDGAILINGIRVKPDDKFPWGKLNSLVFFNGSKHQITML